MKVVENDRSAGGVLGWQAYEILMV